MKKNIKLALVCTVGGHFEQLTNLSEFYDDYDHFWITNRNKQSESQLKDEKKYFIKAGHFTRPWSYLAQIVPLIKAFYLEKPTHILSTGSGMTAFVPYLLARLLSLEFIYIDTFSRVYGYTKFGSFLLRIGHPILSQWEDVDNKKVKYIGPVFKRDEGFIKTSENNHVFVTVGTRDHQFTRLIKAVEELVKKAVITDKVYVQAGHTKYESVHMEIFDFCTPSEIDDYIKEAKYVITQESAGLGTKCLKFNTRFIVMPRDYQFGELPTASDMDEDLQDKLEELGYTRVVHNTAELDQAIINLDQLKTGFTFDNTLAITTLRELVEGQRRIGQSA